MHDHRMSRAKPIVLTAGLLCFTGLFGLYMTSSPQTNAISLSYVMQPQCQCYFGDELYDFCYHLPPEPGIVGQPFSCSNAMHLQRLGLLSKKNVLDMSRDELPRPMFVTAMSDNHYKEGLTLIANIRKFWPQQKVIVYDLGLSKQSVSELQGKCLVEVRSFPFGEYPDYVKKLDEFRWKPLVIAITLEEFGAIWYMDTSVRWKKDRLELVYDEIRCRKDHALPESWNFFENPNATLECGKSAYLLQSSSDHGVFPTTHPGVYEYIPTLLRYLKQRSSENHDAGFVFVVRTADAVNILKWYVLCALEKDCMAPPGARLACRFGDDRFAHYAECHRYDQSVINLLLANAYGYNAKNNYVSCLGKEGAIVNRTASGSLTPNDFLCEVRV